MTTRESITNKRALEVVLAAEAAWNRRDLRALREIYTEDLTYFSNWGGENNGPRTITGRQAYLLHLAGLRDTSDIDIKLVSFSLSGNQARANFEFTWRDPQTGMSHSATSRNVIVFSGDRICRLEVYQDAAALATFATLLKGPPR